MHFASIQVLPAVLAPQASCIMTISLSFSSFIISLFNLSEKKRSPHDYVTMRFFWYLIGHHLLMYHVWAAVVYSSSPPTPSPHRIRCLHSGIETNVTSCRPTLNYIRTFPSYRRIQDFQEGRSPKLPETPPLYVFAVASTCAIEVACGNPSLIDRFSYEIVRALATEIVEECQDEGGFGGWSPVGRGIGWWVRVVGFRDGNPMRNESVSVA